MANQTQQLPPAGKRSPWTIPGIILAVLIPPIGVIVSLVALLETKKKQLKGKRLSIFGVVWGAVFTLPFVFLIWLIVALGGIGMHGLGSFGPHSNDATKAAKPIMAQLDQIGGKKICDNGDPGYGIDNWQPWYDVYYRFTDSANLSGQVQEVMRQQGYNVTRINNQGIYEDVQGYSVQVEGNDWQNGNTTLSTTLSRHATVALRCKDDYNRKEPTGDNGAILKMSFSLPDRNGND
jgi:hypothetical protein